MGWHIKIGVECAEGTRCGSGAYMSTSGNKDHQLAFRGASKDFTVNELTISAGSEYQNETARMLFAAAGITPLLVELKGAAA